MNNLFEQTREQIRNKKIKKASIVAIVSTITTMFFLFISIKFFYAYIVLFIAAVAFTARQLKIIESGKQINIDRENSRFCNAIKKYNKPYDEIMQELSNALKEEGVYFFNNTYITSNWLLDFKNIEVKIINLDEIIWMYKVKYNGIVYIQCHLDDASKYSFSMLDPHKLITKMSEQRPNILFGYSNKIETLMQSNPKEFIKRIKKGIYPNRNGQWEDS